ncbi:MAG: hypothetical protein ACI8XM_002193, partial [Haloarculaceae archaeon]
MVRWAGGDGECPSLGARGYRTTVTGTGDRRKTVSAISPTKR